jgi:uncharacterized protein YaiL (DUF2058 family)
MPVPSPMSSSLKDQLLGLGFKTAPKAEREPKPKAKQDPAHNPSRGKSPAKKSGQARRESQEEVDLAKAYAMRKQQEQRERESAERAKQAAALQKKQAKEAVARLLEGQIQNLPDAEIARHFAYGGKIKRVHVTPEQLTALNAGQLGVVQFNGRYCLVSRDITLAVRETLPALVSLYCDGSEEKLPDDYDDPQYQIPDDLVW